MICKPHGMMNDDGTCPYCSIFELEQQLAELRETLKVAKDLAEFWINRTDTRGMGETDYEIWLAIGHHSKSMGKINAALLPEEGK